MLSYDDKQLYARFPRQNNLASEKPNTDRQVLKE